MDRFNEDILVSFFRFRLHVCPLFTFAVLSVFSVVAELKDDNVHNVILLTATVIHFCLH